MALTLDFPQVDVPRWDKLKVLLCPEVFPRMILQWREWRVLSGPLISLDEWWDEVSSSVAGEDDEEELGGRWCELVFKVGKDLVNVLNDSSLDLKEGEVSESWVRLRSWKEELELRSGWELKTFLVEANFEEWRCENFLFLISIEVFFSMCEVSKELKLEVKSEVKSEDSEGELKTEDVLLK